MKICKYELGMSWIEQETDDSIVDQVLDVGVIHEAEVGKIGFRHRVSVHGVVAELRCQPFRVLPQSNNILIDLLDSICTRSSSRKWLMNSFRRRKQVFFVYYCVKNMI